MNRNTKAHRKFYADFSQDVIDLDASINTMFPGGFFRGKLVRKNKSISKKVLKQKKGKTIRKRIEKSHIVI